MEGDKEEETNDRVRPTRDGENVFLICKGDDIYNDDSAFAKPTSYSLSKRLRGTWGHMNASRILAHNAKEMML